MADQPGLLEALEPEQLELFRVFQRSQRPVDRRVGEDEARGEMARVGCNPVLGRRVFDGEPGTIDLIPGRRKIRWVCTSNGRFGRVSGANDTTSCMDGCGFVHTSGSVATFVGVLSARVSEMRIVDAAGQVTRVEVNADDAYWISVENPVALLTVRTDGTEARRPLMDRDSPQTRDMGVLLERLSGTTRTVLGVAQDEARRISWPCVGSEHLLLALLDASAGPAARALRAVGIDLQRARTQMLNHIRTAEGARSDGDVPLTPRALQILDAACSAAERDASDRIEPAHLLRGLVSVQAGIGSRIIGELAVTDAELINALDNQT